MSAFDPVTRIYLENDPKQTELTTALRNLDARASEIRKNGGVPSVEMKDDINQLSAALSAYRVALSEQLRGRLDKAKTEYRTDREKHSTVELMKQSDAKRLVDSLDDSEVASMALEYVDGADLDLFTLQELRARLRQTPDRETEADMLKTAMQSRRASEPWLNDPETREIADELENVLSTKPGHVRIRADNYEFEKPIENLIDFAGELDR